ncbi:MAG TPA: MYXO-CTERM sorting domain-containing protein [Kofleriaceae bacterium]
MKRALRRVAIAALLCGGAVAATVVACMPPDYGETHQYALVDSGVLGEDARNMALADAMGEPGPTADSGTTPVIDSGTTPGMDSGTTPGMDSGTTPGMDSGTTPMGDGGATTGDGGATTGDDGGGGGDDGTGDDDGTGGPGGSGSQTPTGTPDNNANLDSFYACSTGTPTGSLPVGLVLVGLALRRRRRT